MKVFEKGTIKVVWLGENILEIHSKMFDDSLKAKEFAKTKKDYLILKLIWQKDLNEFLWDLLPYGKYKLYKQLMKIHKQF